jgi:hypothetical protein
VKYETLADLKRAYDSGELLRDRKLVLDNDVVFVYEGEQCVYRSDPGFVMMEALDLLGIPWEEC